jgi:hypothetical protein
MDSGEGQPLVRLTNASCDYRGQIEPDPPTIYIRGSLPVAHVRHLSRAVITYAEQTNIGFNLNTTSSHQLKTAFTPNSILSSTVFSRRAHYFAQSQTSKVYDGAIWRSNPSALYYKGGGPSFGCVVSRRLCVAGFSSSDTLIQISRVDREDIFAPDESVADTNVLRAGYIDISNNLSSGDSITGLAPWEQNKLAIFTQDRVLIYTITPEINSWAVDTTINIQVGCLSHNTIAQAGGDMIFCSRSGVYTFRREIYNGITITTTPISVAVTPLYRALIAQVSNPQNITAALDRDEGLYHIFFPCDDGVTRRLTCALSTSQDTPNRWSTGDRPIGARCATFLGGSMVWGSSEGIYLSLRRDNEIANSPEAIIETPYLWHGDLINVKETQNITIMASGKGTISLEALDETDRVFHQESFEIEPEADDSDFSGMPLNRQYARNFEHRYRCVRLRFTMVGRGQMRLTGFAIRLKRL